MDKRDIENLTLGELKKELKKHAIPSYRAEQVFSWIYKKGVTEFSKMLNLPKDLRETLSKHYSLGTIKLKKKLESADGTEKFLFELSDGSLIESVLIISRKRKTICLSTQVGCKFRCLFCASGLKGFVRNLTSSEIIGQILFVKHNLGHSITNFVFMGMGEPLDNYDNVRKALFIMNHAKGLGVGARRITISTSGITPAIRKLKSLNIQVNLAISLHASDGAKRDRLMPVNKVYPLRKLISACEEDIKTTHRKITLEYVLIKDENDSLKDANGLLAIAKRLKATVNLIPYSPVQGMHFQAPSNKEMSLFKNHLIKNRVNVTMRESKGKDIQAACGQLGKSKRT